MIKNSIFIDELNKYYSIWQKYNYVYEEWVKAHCLSVNNLLVLCAINENEEDCTQKKISQKWMMPKQTVNMVLRDFENKGFVELVPIDQDRRNKFIKLTKEGKKYTDSILSELRKTELFAIEKIGIENMKQLNNNASLFLEFLDKAMGIGK